jgi:hypothetical protein
MKMDIKHLMHQIIALMYKEQTQKLTVQEYDILNKHYEHRITYLIDDKNVIDTLEGEVILNGVELSKYNIKYEIYLTPEIIYPNASLSLRVFYERDTWDPFPFSMDVTQKIRMTSPDNIQVRLDNLDW